MFYECVIRNNVLECGGTGVHPRIVEACGGPARLYKIEFPGPAEYTVEAETPVGERVICNAIMHAEWVWGSSRYTRWETGEPVLSLACIGLSGKLSVSSDKRVLGACLGEDALDELARLSHRAGLFFGYENIYPRYIAVEARGLGIRETPLTTPGFFTRTLAYSPIVKAGLALSPGADMVAAEAARLLEARPSALEGFPPEYFSPPMLRESLRLRDSVILDAERCLLSIRSSGVFTIGVRRGSTVFSTRIRGPGVIELSRIFCGGGEPVIIAYRE